MNIVYAEPLRGKAGGGVTVWLVVEESTDGRILRTQEANGLEEKVALMLAWRAEGKE